MRVSRAKYCENSASPDRRNYSTCRVAWPGKLPLGSSTLGNFGWSTQHTPCLERELRQHSLLRAPAPSQFFASKPWQQAIPSNRHHTGLGLPYMTSAYFWEFFIHPPVTVTNQLILFLSSAFLGPPPPPTAEVLGEGDASMKSAHCWVLHTSCFSFSSQFLSTEQEERRRPQTGQTDRKTG